MDDRKNVLENGIKAIAVIGMACRFPGAPTKESFLQMQLEGRSNYSELSADRLNEKLYYSPEKGLVGKTYSRVGAAFDLPRNPSDRLTGGTSSPEGLSDDPGHRLAHDVAMEACRDAGYSTTKFPYEKTGVFMGCTRLSLIPCDQVFLKGLPAVLAYLDHVRSFSNLAPSIREAVLGETGRLLQGDDDSSSCWNLQRLHANLAAWNIAKSLKSTGPAMIMDAACSSSLAALAVASRSLSAGTIDVALLGGNSFFAFDSLVLFSKAQSIATELSCPFDRRASGLICGEAHLFFVLKTLEKAVADGDRIYGVIRGIGASSDGKGKTLWAPRKEGQTEAVLRAFQGGGADPANLRYIEAHATSTPLGDPTEMAALGEAMKGLLTGGQRVHVGSVKANVGHTLEAAGAVGLMKTLLMLKYKVIPPQIHLSEPNAAIPWDELPVDIATKPERLTRNEPGRPIQLAVNAFGIGGINFHVVVEEYLPEKSAKNTVAEKPAETKPVSGENDEDPGAVAIIGMGCVLPGANNVPEFAKLLRGGNDPKTELSVTEWDRLGVADGVGRPEVLRGKKLLGGFVTGWEYDWKKHRIAPLQISRANPLQFMILDAVDQALEDAGCGKKAFDGKKTAVVIGTRFGGDFGNSLQMAVQWPEIREALRTSLRGQGIVEPESGRILAEYEKTFFQRLPALQDETGSFTSSSFASRVTKTFDFMGGAFCIDAGRVGSLAALEAAVDMIRSGECETVVCAGAQRHCGTIAFESLAREGRLASVNRDPLDAGSDGVFPGEGVGVVILKSLRRAMEDGDTVRAVIRGIGSGSGETAAESADVAFRASKTRSRVDLRRVGLLEIAAGTKETDPLHRFVAVRDEQKDPSRDQAVGIGSLAGQIGDLGEAAGMASLIKAVLSLEEMEIPGVFGFREAPASLSGLPFRVSSSGSPLSSCNADGSLFASVFDMDRVDGMAVSYNVILERATKTPVAPSEEVPTATIRPLIPATTETKSPALWAMMFPGQGSQYHGMLRTLAEASPRCREIVSELDDSLQKLGFPTLAAMAWERPDRLGKDVFLTQLSLLACDTVYAQLLNDYGVHASLHLGHSYGEYPALVAAGGWTFETAATATKHRCDAIESLRGKPSGMLSTNADPELLERLFRTITSGRLFISNRNTPEQLVVSGEITALNELDTAIKREKRASLILPVPAGFHSPLVEDVCGPLRAAFEKLPIRFPERAFLSGVTGRFEAEPSELREAFVEQMVRPVDFVALLEKSYENGVRRFVEAGPRTLLGNMGKKILPGDAVAFLSCDVPKGNAEKMLERLEEIAALYRRDRVETVEMPRPLEIQSPPATPSVDMTTEPDVPPFPSVSAGSRRDDLLLPADMLCIELSGTPYEIGCQSGRLLKRHIRKVLGRYADIAGQANSQLPDVSDGMGRIDRLFTVEALEELRGIADAAGVPLPSLLRHNLSVYPDSTRAVTRNEKKTASPSLGLACTYFAGRTRDGDFLQGANIDVPIYRMLSGSHVGVMQIRRPDGKKAHVLAGGSGFVGGIFGINADGLSVVGASLSDLPPTPEISGGLVPTLLIERLLAEAGTLEEAVALIRTTPRTASWSLCLAELATGRMVQVEYSGTRLIVREDVTWATAANHQRFLGKLLPEPLPEAPAHSVARLNRLHELLPMKDGRFQVDADRAFAVLRDKWDLLRHCEPKHRTINTIWRIDNTLSLLIDAARGVLHLASTDLTRTDGVDTPGRHVEIPLRMLLPELDEVLKNVAAEKKIEIPAPGVPPDDFPVTTREEYVRRNTSCADREPLPVDMKFNRYVPRLLEAKFEADRSRTFTGAALIVADDENRIGLALAELLTERNVRFFHLSPDLPLDEVAGELQRIDEECPLNHLFFLGATEPCAKTSLNETDWGKTYEQDTALPIAVLKEWTRLTARRKAFEECTLSAPLRLGGDFGLGRKVESAYSGALSGLLKGLAMELSAAGTSPRIKLVDQESGLSPETVAEQLFHEVWLGDDEREISYKNGKRYALRYVLDPLNERTSPKRPRKERWIITGGARGITAAIAHEIGRKRGASLVLVGSSSLPEIDPTWKNLDDEGRKILRARIFKEAAARKDIPVKAWERVEKAMEIDRNLDALKRAGIEFEYHACDLSDPVAARRLLNSISDAPVTGVVHGAGFELAAQIKNKKTEAIRKTFDVKVKGAANLLRALEEKRTTPEMFIGFSSVSGRFGGVGQVDYCAANEMLAKLLDWYDGENPACRIVSFHWPAWGEIGMAARPESKLALSVAGLEFMAPEEGVAHVLNEIARNLDLRDEKREREILVSDWNYYKRFYPDVPPIPDGDERPETGDAVTTGPMSILGDNADADALSERAERENGFVPFRLSETKSWSETEPSFREWLESQSESVLVVTVPRDPVAACLRGERHWNERLSDEITISARCCFEMISAAKSKPGSKARLFVLTSIGLAAPKRGVPYVPEGALLLECLKEWSVGSDIDLQVLDFAADASPDFVAETVLAVAREETVPGRRETLAVETGTRGDLDGFERPPLPFGNWEDSLAVLRRIASPYIAPLFDEIVQEQNGGVSANGTLRPLEDVFLLEHRMNQKPILPMVVAMEAFAETIVAAVERKILPGGSRLIGIDRLDIRQGLVCRANEPYRYRIRCVADSSDRTKYHGTFLGDYYDVNGRLLRSDKVYSTAEMRIAGPGEISDENNASSPHWNIVPDRWAETWYPEAGAIQIYHGPAFRCMRRANDTGVPNAGLVELHVPDPMQILGNGGKVGRRLFRDGKPVEIDGGAVTTAALIDSALFGCGLLYWYYHNDCVCIPAGIERFRFGPARPEPGEIVYAHLLLSDHGDEKTPPLNRTAGFDFTIRTATGEIVCDVKGYRATILKKPGSGENKQGNG